MKSLYVAAVLSVVSLPAFGQLYPNPTITPGAVRSTDTAEICSPSFRTGDYRHTTAAMKRQVYNTYGLTDRHAGYCSGPESCEVDHLIPLYWGGADDVRNLWPEPYGMKCGAHDKDKVEVEGHKRICSGQISITEAQHKIATNWVAFYKELFGHGCDE